MYRRIKQIRSTFIINDDEYKVRTFWNDKKMLSIIGVNGKGKILPMIEKEYPELYFKIKNCWNCSCSNVN